MLHLIKNTEIEFKKRFSKNGEFRKGLNYLKELKRKYPQDELVNTLIQIFRKKIYGIRGVSFIPKKITEIFESIFPFQAEFVEIEGIKFDLSLSSARDLFCKELVDILCSDDYFEKSQVFFHQIMKSLQYSGEGPYQLNLVYLQEGDVVIDAGANMGVFSLYANHYKKCKCYAFEPVQITIELLKKNIALNKKEDAIEVIPFGLSDKECDIDIELSLTDIGSSSFVQKPVGEFAGVEKIYCVTLDKWAKENNIQKIDFIKADIEGAERYMLLGATEVLKEFAPKLSICTYHLPDDPQVLEEIILKANPKYKVEHAYKKLYAYVP